MIYLLKLSCHARALIELNIWCVSLNVNSHFPGGSISKMQLKGGAKGYLGDRTGDERLGLMPNVGIQCASTVFRRLNADFGLLEFSYDNVII